mgnify:CR=1 FL=1
MIIPPVIRQFIPLKFWPQFCYDMQELYDVTFEMMEEHNANWKPGDEISTLMGLLETDRHNGTGVTESDIVHTIHALMFGK